MPRDAFVARLKTFSLLALVLAAPLLAACQSTQTTESGAVGVERQQTMLLSNEDVNRSAAQAYRREMAALGRSG